MNKSFLKNCAEKYGSPLYVYDLNKLDKNFDDLKKSFVKEENKRLLEIKKLTGQDVEIWAAASVAKAFDTLKVPYERTAKTKAPSFTTNLPVPTYTLISC